VSDRELLELAAKAAGYGEVWIFGAPKYRVWNPLVYDDDALRLAVKLGLGVEVGSLTRGFTAVRTDIGNWMEFREPHGTDPDAATRRAIVRAAAEIGKEHDMTDKYEQLQRLANLPHKPTPLTYELRMAVNGEGPRAYDWADKPHRLLYDACDAIERAAAIARGEA
jgi:hypothetical protein